ncbi:MAG: hypothetical protein HY319_28570 [Armatimonadetes bacterium]|nr:hypothetical protein [Armatimonadota bacterium]
MRLFIQMMRHPILTVILIAAALWLAAYRGTGLYFEGQVQQRIDQLKKDGKRTTLEEMVPEAVPAALNAAPFYLAAFELNRQQGGFSPGSGPLLEQYRADRQKLDAMLQARDLSFGLLAEAYARPGCRFDLDYESGFLMEHPNLSGFRTLHTLAGLRVVQLVDQERGQEAVTVAAHAVRSLRRFRMGDDLVGRLVTWAATDRLCDGLEALADSRLRADYRPLLDELDALIEEEQDGFLRAIEGERMFAHDLFQKLSRGDVSYQEILGENLSGLPLAMYQLGGRPLLLADEVSYLDRTRKAEQAVEEGRPEVLEELGTPRAAFSNVLSPNYSRAYKLHSRIRERLGSLRERLESPG